MSEAVPRRYPSAGHGELVAVAAALAVFLVYAYHAVVLIRYPWDWSPDEGLFLDYARRLVHAPETLYPVGRSVPFPLAWTPLLPALLAPVVELAAAPLAVARMLALAWTAATAAGVYVFVRRGAPRALAAAAAALSLAPLDLSFWYMLVRLDGLMVALWIWAGVVLAPPRLQRGASRLGWGRAGAGSLLLAAAFLAKPTAVVHAVPLLLVWFLVDAASGLRLAVVAGLMGAAVVGALQLASGGGFFWVQGLWRQHPWQLALFRTILAGAAGDGAALVLAWLIALALALRARTGAWRDAGLGLWAGGLAALPALGKYGSSSNYVLPLAAAMAVLVGRWLGAWSEAASNPEARRRRAAGAALAVAAGAAVIVSSTRFPLPTARDARAAEFLYRLLDERGAPILALRPDYAYFRLRQPVEAEGSSFVLLLGADVPGTEMVMQRIEQRHYRTIVVPPELWYVHTIMGFVRTHYREEASVALGTCFGPLRWVVLVPRESGQAALTGPPSGL